MEILPSILKDIFSAQPSQDQLVHYTRQAQHVSIL